MPTGAESKPIHPPPVLRAVVGRFTGATPRTCSSGWPTPSHLPVASSTQQRCSALAASPRRRGPVEAFKSAAGCRERGSIVRFPHFPASCHCDRRSKPRREVVGCCVANGHKHLYYSPLLSCPAAAGLQISESSAMDYARSS